MTTAMFRNICPLAILLILLAAPAAAQQYSRTMPATVTHIVDGDTVDVLAYPYPGMTMTARVRLLGVDTPEIYKPLCDEERDLGRVASAFARSHLTEQVWLVDVQDEMDGLSRILARIVTTDGLDLGRELMAAGLAKVERKGHGEWCG